jgi:hypothetical protein
MEALGRFGELIVKLLIDGAITGFRTGQNIYKYIVMF